MHVPTNRFEFHKKICRFCNSENIVPAGVTETCARCGKILTNSPTKIVLDGTTIYFRKKSRSFVQFCEDNWITWTDCRNTDGYVWVKEECDVSNTIACLGLPMRYSNYSPHFDGPAWMLVANGPLENILACHEDGPLFKNVKIYQNQKQIIDKMSDTVSAQGIPSL